MEKRSLCLVGLLSITLIISLALPLYGQTPAPPKASDKPETKTKNYSKEPEASKKETKSPSPIPVVPVPEQGNIPSYDKADKHGDKSPSSWWLIGFTGALVVVSFLQYLILRKQTHWMHEQSKEIGESVSVARETAEAVKLQAQTMRDEFTLKCRSKIHVRDIAIPEFENPSGRHEFPNGQLSIVNLGGMPANIIEIGAWFEIGCEKGFPAEWPDESQKPNVPNPQPTQLEVGGSVRYEFTDERRFWSHYEPIRMKPNDYTLYIIGYVKYTDATRLPRYTRIFRAYRVPKGQIGLHKPSRRFFPVEGYEYEE